MKTLSLLALLLLIAAGAYFAGRQHHHHSSAAAPAAGAAAAVYQCPMHPWIKSDHADAKCTICGMALVAATGGPAADQAVDPNLVTLTPAQAAVTGVQTATVTRGPLVRTIRVNGVIDDDDTRHRILAARVPGRIEKLHVNYVGAEVEAGAPLATVFSPEMLTAQRTYVERLKGGISFTVSERALARERLLELGLTEEEIRILEGTLQPTAMVNVRAPLSGTVVSRSVYEGQYVETNDPLFEIGDFSRMWFVFDAYEPDLAWIKPGQTVELTVPSLPGQILTAPITFIDPNLDANARTARVRVILDNAQRLLLHKQTAQAIVRTESPETLLVPRSAVLQHGGKPVVFVARDGHAYSAREIRLGRSGDRHAEVLAGLREGDRVVTEGALILDGQAQLAHAAVGGGDHDHGTAAPTPVSVAAPEHDAAAVELLKALAFATADAADALASDDLAAYERHLAHLRPAAAAYVAGFAPAARGPLVGFADKLVAGPDLDAARRAFEPFSTAVADAARAEHLHHREKLWIYQCPMTPVLGTGRWLSRQPELRNPFFGSAMLECGDEVN
ncbi:MAG: efflux RND transporter periplasmic adaptor subunit [Opitutaceae bacterium]|nr:efflux RND transporter periplasmic adaptor subunit [Opitutaceae bacterium]